MCVEKLQEKIALKVKHLEEIRELSRTVRKHGYITGAGKVKICADIKEEALLIKKDIIALVSDLCQDIIEDEPFETVDVENDN